VQKVLRGDSTLASRSPLAFADIYLLTVEVVLLVLFIPVALDTGVGIITISSKALKGRPCFLSFLCHDTSPSFLEVQRFIHSPTAQLWQYQTTPNSVSDCKSDLRREVRICGSC